jgi:hypothetical protein
MRRAEGQEENREDVSSRDEKVKKKFEDKDLLTAIKIVWRMENEDKMKRRLDWSTGSQAHAMSLKRLYKRPTSIIWEGVKS